MDTYKIKNTLINGLNASKIFKSETTETLLITLEKDTVFPTHVSPKETLLIVLEGAIDFYINDKTIHLTSLQLYTFPDYVEHYVIALKDAKFLIIR